MPKDKADMVTCRPIEFILGSQQVTEGTQLSGRKELPAGYHQKQRDGELSGVGQKADG